MDLQFKRSVFGAANYICGYLSKPNKAMSYLMRTANQELRKQPTNPSLKQLRSSTRTVVFIHASPPDHRFVMLTRSEDIADLQDYSHVCLENFPMRYLHWPDNAEHICLAEWMSEFKMVDNSKNRASTGET